MRKLAAFAVIAASLTLSAAFDAIGPNPIALVQPKQDASNVKPPSAGSDLCVYAYDMQCDEPGIGTGACEAETDQADCEALRTGRDNDDCSAARDGVCDEPIFGSGECVQGSDRSDCGDLFNIRNRDDSCDTAFNGVCEAPGSGSGACAARTDRADCMGRARPLTINDHFNGNDDRVRVSINEAPWRFMGRLEMISGNVCSAILIAPDVIVTAAHCISVESGFDARATFVAAQGDRAHVTAYLADPAFNLARFNRSEIAGLDWALLRLDRPLGATLGYATLGRVSNAALPRFMMNAGYSWDTGARLNARVSCPMVELRSDNSFTHECDTTRGDSGSGYVVRNGNGFELVGIDSAFHRNASGPDSYIGVSVDTVAAVAPDFIAGRSGIPLAPARPPKD